MYLQTTVCTALNCTEMNYTLSSNIKGALHALHCTALHCTALHCTALHCICKHTGCTVLHCTELNRTALHCTALHCTALSYTVSSNMQGQSIMFKKMLLPEHQATILNKVFLFAISPIRFSNSPGLNQPCLPVDMGGFLQKAPLKTCNYD